jgi:hypothetical protein
MTTSSLGMRGGEQASRALSCGLRLVMMPRACSITSYPLTIPCVRSTFCVKPLGCNHFLMSTTTRATRRCRDRRL